MTKTAITEISDFSYSSLPGLIIFTTGRDNRPAAVEEHAHRHGSP
jgi:hypothetical protein